MGTVETTDATGFQYPSNRVVDRSSTRQRSDDTDHMFQYPSNRVVDRSTGA